MIDLQQLRAAAGNGGIEEVPVTRDFLAQVLDELVARRAAQEGRGQVFARKGLAL